MTKDDSMRVGIIGGGLGGLAAACTLAARGRQVTLFERNEFVGGKAAVLQKEGFRFDMGPTILTLPSVLRRIFAEAGRKLEDHLDLIRLDPQWRCFFDGGDQLDLTADVPTMQQALAAFSNNPQVPSGYGRFIEMSAELNRISDRFFFWKSVGSIKDTLDFSTMFDVKVLGDLLKLRMGQTVAGTVRRFVGDARVAQMIDHFTQYVGSAPDASPAVLCGIAHMQTDEGIWYPRGGTRAVPEALLELAGDLGVELRTGCGVSRVLAEGGRVRGLVDDRGKEFAFDAVISNCDSVLTHQELINGDVRRRFLKRRSYEPACSGVVMYLGLDRRYDHLLHHNFVFSKDAEEEFESIYRHGEPAPDPTCYVCAPAISEPEVAPAGCEALYILVHTPYLREGQNWQEMYPRYRQVILDKLASTAGMENLEQNIVSESYLTPEDIRDRYHVPAGAIYGLASHGRFLGAFKPANRSPDLQGFYLAGGSAHPGPGMPMALMSGWIAADSLDQDYGGAGATVPQHEVPLRTSGQS